MAEGHSVLIFCGGRRQTQACAAQVAELLPALLGAPVTPEARAARQKLASKLRDGLGGAPNKQLESLFGGLGPGLRSNKGDVD